MLHKLVSAGGFVHHTPKEEAKREREARTSTDGVYCRSVEVFFSV